MGDANRTNSDDLLAAFQELQEAAAMLMAQYEIEEEEHGFPFNFALRKAHRNMKRVLRKHVGGHRGKALEGSA